MVLRILHQKMQKKTARTTPNRKKDSIKLAHQLFLLDYDYYSRQIADCQEKPQKKEHFQDDSF